VEFGSNPLHALLLCYRSVTGLPCLLRSKRNTPAPVGDPRLERVSEVWGIVAVIGSSSLTRMPQFSCKDLAPNAAIATTHWTRQVLC
jgi:hypothetical protein